MMPAFDPDSFALGALATIMLAVAARWLWRGAVREEERAARTWARANADRLQRPAPPPSTPRGLSFRRRRRFWRPS